MRLSKSQATALARLVSDLRADWDFHGVLAALQRIAGRSGFDAAHIALAAAADPDAQTPAAMTNPIYAPDWHPSTQAERDENLTRRVREIRDRRVLDENRHAQRQHDPVASHRGYLHAVTVLRSVGEDR